MAEKIPAGPVPLHKALAMGASLKEAESKALGKAPAKPSKR